MAVSLTERASAWYEAGRLSARVLAAAVDARQHVPEERAVVFDKLPMRYYGAYVFSSGLPEAVTLRTGLGSGRVIEAWRSLGESTPIPENAVWFDWDGQDFRLRTTGQGDEDGS